MMIFMNIVMIFINIVMVFINIIMIFFLIEYFHHKKKSIFVLCMYKVVNIDKDTDENNDIEAIVNGIGKLWLNEKHIEGKLGHKNLPVITNKCDQEYIIHRYELINEAKKQPNRRFLRSDLALKVIMGCRTDE